MVRMTDQFEGDNRHLNVRVMTDEEIDAFNVYREEDVDNVVTFWKRHAARKQLLNATIEPEE